MKRFVLATVLCLLYAPAFAGVECTKISDISVAAKSGGYETLVVQRTAIKGHAGQWGFVMIEIFGLGRDQARTFGDDNIRGIESCVGEGIKTLKYHVRAYPEDTDKYRGHTVEIPVPKGLKDVQIRWCSKIEGGCLRGKYTGGGVMELAVEDIDKGPKRSILKD